MVGSIKNFTGQRVEVSKGMTEAKTQAGSLLGQALPLVLALRLMLY